MDKIMNDIKFRYYDKFNGVMSNPSDEYKCIADFFAWHGVLVRAENGLELMQFTGLQDNNGVDIYDGDIVMYQESDSPNDESSIDEVKMIKGCWSWEGENLYDFEGLLVVIGNIHQNAELLVAK